MNLAASSPTAVTDDLLAYVRKEFLDDDDSADLTATSPLLEWGILNSMTTVRLVAHVKSEFGVVIPPQRMSAGNFRDLESIVQLVQELAQARTGGE
jgi:acyl carrier protein